MKTALLIILSILFLSQRSHAQNSCADSVRITYFYHDYDRWTQYTEASIAMDTFDLDSGIVRGCTISGPDANNLNITNCSQSYWSKKILSTDSLGRVTERLILTGSVNGWENSNRIVFSYDSATNKIAGQSDETWDGTVWVQNKSQSWFYDPSANLIERTDVNYSGGTIQNGNRTTWNYNSDTLISKNTYMLVGLSWTNVNQFVFSYDSSGIRDSILLLHWNSNMLMWDTTGNSPYYFENGKKLAEFILVDTIYVNNIPNLDTIIFSIDTLENTIHYYQLLPTNYDPMGLFYTMTYANYDYFAGELKNTWEYSAEWFDDGSDELAWYCTNNNLTTNYDSAGYITSTIQSARCVMPQSFTNTYYYNSDHVLIRITGELDNNTQYEYYSYDYFFGTADSISAFVSPFYPTTWYLCQNTTLQPQIVAIGGCGTYHYQWTPNINLSSDTIPDPEILVNDSLSYTITVTDSSGNIGLAHFDVFPTVTSGIEIDTVSCIGCVPVIETNYHPEYVYQWYFNGALIPNSDTSAIEPLLSGSYFVVVSSINEPCVSISDTVYYVGTLSESALNRPAIFIYPNPADEFMNIQFYSVLHGKISIYNSLGKKEECKIISDNEFLYTIELKEQPAGIYILEITTESERYLKKFIKN